MSIRLKFFLVLIVYIFCVSLSAAESILIPQNAPLFQFEKKWVVKGIAQREFYAEVIKKEKKLLLQTERTGIYTDAYRLKIAGTEGLYYIPAANFKAGTGGKRILYFDKIDSLMILGVFLFAVGLAALAGYFHLKTEKKKYLLPISLLFFFWGYAVWYIGMISDAFIRPTDEVQYFMIAGKILDWDFTSLKFRYTAGFPILCIPFIYLFHLQDCLEFVQIYMNFQTFILIPGFFLLLYWFFYKKMGYSFIQSYFILLTWLILMIFYSPLCSYLSDPSVQYIPTGYSCNAHFSLPDDNAYLIYGQCTWLGRNAMSDYLTVFLLIILLVFSIKRTKSLIRLFLLSMGFGFLCMVRINYIFFSPLLAFIFFDSFSELWQNKKNFLYAALWGSAGFMSVFIWQFVLNKIQFGSPWIWPYSLHDFAPDRGFVWKVVPYGFKFLCQTNYVYLVSGMTSLFFIPDRRNRVLLTLWIFPMLIFFTGYPIVFNNPTRFLFALYAPLLAAVILNPVWKSSWNIRIKTGLVVLGSCLLCKSNIFFIYSQPWGLKELGISNTLFMIIQGIICLFCCAVIFSMRKELKADYSNTIQHLRFLILFTAVFYLGSVCSYIVGILMSAAFIYGLRDTFLIIPQVMNRTSEKNISGNCCNQI